MGFIGKALAGLGGGMAAVGEDQFKADLIAERDKRLHEFSQQNLEYGSQLRREEVRGGKEIELEYAPRLAQVDINKQEDLYHRVESPRLVQQSDLQRENLLRVEAQRAANQLAQVETEIRARKDEGAANRASHERIAAAQVRASLGRQGLAYQVDADGYASVVNLANGTMTRLIDEDKKPIKAAKDSDVSLRMLTGLGNLATAAANSGDAAGAKFWTEAARGVAGSLLGGRGIDVSAPSSTTRGGANGWDPNTGEIRWSGQVVRRDVKDVAEAKRILDRIAEEQKPTNKNGLVGGALSQQRRSDQRIYGPLTSRNVIERDAAAGIPAAIEYLRRLNEASAEDQREMERIRQSQPIMP